MSADHNRVIDSGSLTGYTKLKLLLILMLILGQLWKCSARIYNSINSWPSRSVQQVRALVSRASLFFLELFTKRPINILQTVGTWSPHQFVSFSFSKWQVWAGKTTYYKWKPKSVVSLEYPKYTVLKKFLFEHIEAGFLVSRSLWICFTAFILFPRAINETLSAPMTTTTFLDHVIATLAHLLLSHALMDEFGYVNNLYIIWS